MTPSNLPMRGEIWLVDLDPSVGDEMKKTRPVIVVSTNYIRGLDLRIVVPTTTWRVLFEGKFWFVKLEATAVNGLDSLSAANTFQVKSLSTQRFRRKLGCLSAADMENVEEVLKLVMEL